MYHFMVRKIIHRAFSDLSKGNSEAVLSQFSPDIHFMFEGEHAMGSELHSLDGVRQWFQRVSRLFPGLQFKVRQVIVSGWPWNTVVATKLQVEAKLQSGDLYQNSLVQIVQLRWGRVMDDYLLENTQKLAATLRDMAQQGLAEAAAPPIKD
jgi:ketosteroid isomerase-like protein